MGDGKRQEIIVRNMPIQENLAYIRSWYNEAVGEIPGSIQHKASFCVRIFSLLDEKMGVKLRVIVNLSFLHASGDAQHYFEKLRRLFREGNSQILWDWVRDRQNDHLDRGWPECSHVLAAWDRTCPIGDELGIARRLLASRLGSIREARRLWESLAKIEAGELLEKEAEVKMTLNRAIRLFKENESSSFEDDAGSFEKRVLEYLGLPDDSSIISRL
jgi:hypothetical protein